MRPSPEDKPLQGTLGQRILVQRTGHGTERGEQITMTSTENTKRARRLMAEAAQRGETLKYTEALRQVQDARRRSLRLERTGSIDPLRRAERAIGDVYSQYSFSSAEIEELMELARLSPEQLKERQREATKRELLGKMRDGTLFRSGGRGEGGDAIAPGDAISGSPGAIKAEELQHVIFGATRKGRPVHLFDPKDPYLVGARPADAVADSQIWIDVVGGSQPVDALGNVLVAALANQGGTLTCRRLIEAALRKGWDVSVVRRHDPDYATFGDRIQILDADPEMIGSVEPGTAARPRLVIIDPVDYASQEWSASIDLRALISDPHTAVVLRSQEPKTLSPEIRAKLGTRILAGRSPKHMSAPSLGVAPEDAPAFDASAAERGRPGMIAQNGRIERFTLETD